VVQKAAAKAEGKLLNYNEETMSFSGGTKVKVVHQCLRARLRITGTSPWLQNQWRQGSLREVEGVKRVVSNRVPSRQRRQRPNSLDGFEQRCELKLSMFDYSGLRPR